MTTKILFSASFILICQVTCLQNGKSAQPVSGQKSSNDLYMLVGTYTSGTSKGISVYRFDMDHATAEFVSEAPITNPSYLAVSQDGRFVYSVSENKLEEATASAFAFDKQTGILKLLNSQPTKGASPCYISVDRSNRFVVTANYMGGSVSVFPVAGDGSLQPVAKIFDFKGTGPDERRQEQAHLHCVFFSPDQKYLFAEDLGTDKIHKFNVSNQPPFLSLGIPESFSVEPGSGPRHLTFHPNGKFAYLINELSGKVTVFKYSGGNLGAIQYIAADKSPGTGGKSSADIHVSPDGKFLYVSNRLEPNGIAIFSINVTDGKLTDIGYQQTGNQPRNFIVTPNGKYLLVANQNSNNIQVFTIDRQTGLLTDTEKQISINKPVCIKFVSK